MSYLNQFETVGIELESNLKKSKNGTAEMGVRQTIRIYQNSQRITSTRQLRQFNTRGPEEGENKNFTCRGPDFYFASDHPRPHLVTFAPPSFRPPKHRTMRLEKGSSLFCVGYDQIQY